MDFDDWVKFQSVDKAAVNVLIGKITDKPTVPCQGHLLNLEGGLMTRNNNFPEETIESVQETMKDVKNIIKNAAILRNLTPYWSTLCNKTRGTGRHDV